MAKIQFKRFDILKELDSLTAGISDSRFVQTRPNAVGEQMKDFLLLRLPQAMRDRGDTYQTTYGQIVIFVRDVNGMENTFRLEQMQKQVVEQFPIVNELFHAKNLVLLASASDGAGFHSLTIQFNITILKSTF